jgi:hypothetical protein
MSPSSAKEVSQRFTGNGSEWNGYLGVTLIVALLFVFARFWRNRTIRATSLFALLMLVLAFGPYLHLDGHNTGIPSLYWPIAHIPLLNDLQPNRLPVFVFLAAGLALAYLLQRAWRIRAGPVVAVMIAAVVLVPLMPRVPLMSFPVSVPAYFTSSAVEQIPDQAVVATVPWAAGSMGRSVPMLWQAESRMRFRILGGYFLGPEAPNQTLLHSAAQSIARDGRAPELDGAARSELMAELALSKVQAVIVGPYAHEALAVQFFDDLLGFAPHTYGDVNVWLLPDHLN